ncbi:hypothetical protein JOF41_006448 [Saccharothrix coeruleofusca]|uniref:hypothetical protein n=1 Tax=Saccharothrix coeruleofusca TaxID=33919 RepID=UPI001AE2987B|nr:hypothetical protein [Saccharothrix coeruleofusca]MBP2340270.1 hypothetical protein [Saccharothrix coeruleofusca]
MGRKNHTMMPITGGQGGRKVVPLLVLLVLLALVLRDPVGAAHAAQRLGDWGGYVLDALGTFGSTVGR